MSNRRVRKGVLRVEVGGVTLGGVDDERVIEREDVDAILNGLFDIRFFLSVLVENTGGFGEEEEDEA